MPLGTTLCPGKKEPLVISVGVPFFQDTVYNEVVRMSILFEEGHAMLSCYHHTNIRDNSMITRQYKN